MARTLTSLAILYRDQGKYEKAEPLFRRAIEINEKKQRLEHPDLAITLENDAQLLNKYREAEATALEERVQAIRAQQE